MMNERARRATTKTMQVPYTTIAETARQWHEALKATNPYPVTENQR